MKVDLLQVRIYATQQERYGYFNRSHIGQILKGSLVQVHMVDRVG